MSSIHEEVRTGAVRVRVRRRSSSRVRVASSIAVAVIVVFGLLLIGAPAAATAAVADAHSATSVSVRHATAAAQSQDWRSPDRQDDASPGRNPAVAGPSVRATAPDWGGFAFSALGTTGLVAAVIAFSLRRRRSVQTTSVD
jgi:hypothetical protein